MSFMELARSRFSERRFSARPVEDEKLNQILEAGRIAPTACNLQPQVVYVVRSAATLERVKGTGASLCGCPVALLVCYDRDAAWRNPREDYCSGEQDASVVAASMMFAAEDLGVHTLWIRGFDSRAMAEACGLPENHVPGMVLALGYPGEKSHPARLHDERKPLGETVREL